MQKIWKVKEKKYDDIIHQLLFNRGVISDNINTANVENFLNPKFDTFFENVEFLPDFLKAISRIKKAIDDNEKIGIFSDYDADGIPGAALLYKAFSKLGIETFVSIPTRDEGYGFNKSGLDKLINSGCTLIISIDLGIREFEYSEYLLSKEIDLIITDHHEQGERLPSAYAIVNPKIKNSSYTFREICGAAVVYKIIFGLSKYFPDVINESFLKWNIDLVTISTVSDVVPIINENRTLVKFGLDVLRKTRNIGLQELYKISNINQNEISTYVVGFQIGPRINAPGRLESAEKSFELLVTNDRNVAFKNAKILQEKNQTRQNMMDKIYETACKIIEKNNLSSNKIIILKKTGWQKGLLGPVASRLVEKYFHPVIIMSDGEVTIDGSCRSIPGFDITKALESNKKYILSFGGHVGAAGIHLEKKNFDIFSSQMEIYAKKNISDDLLLPKIEIDMEISQEKISISLFKKIEKIEPFGFGNPAPIFLTKQLKLSKLKLVGKDNKHCQLRFSNGIGEIKGILFNFPEINTEIVVGRNYDVVYQPALNFWNGKNWLDLKIIDLKLSE